jgi:hypothetical protein
VAKTAGAEAGPGQGSAYVGTTRDRTRWTSSTSASGADRPHGTGVVTGSTTVTVYAEEKSE